MTTPQAPRPIQGLCRALAALRRDLSPQARAHLATRLAYVWASWGRHGGDRK